MLQLERICIYLVNKIIQKEDQNCAIRRIEQVTTNWNCECEIWYGYDLTIPTPVAVQSKAWVCGYWTAEIAGSNPAEVMDIHPLRLLCCCVGSPLRPADHSSRGVLPRVMCRCVGSRNLSNEAA